MGRMGTEGAHLKQGRVSTGSTHSHIQLIGPAHAWEKNPPCQAVRTADVPRHG